MAHNLDFVVAEDGRRMHAAMFAVVRPGFEHIDTPWHARETNPILLDSAPTLQKALSYGLDYPLAKRPTLAVVGEDENGNVTVARSRSSFTIWRTDREIELGSVGPDYVPVDNGTSFRVFEPLLDSGVCELETGGVVNGGADAWLLARFNLERFGPIVREVFTDELLPYAIVMANHNGRRRITVATVTVRVVCNNTLQLAEVEAAGGNSVGVSHRGDAEVKLVEAAETVLGGIIERYAALAESYKLLKQTILDRQTFERLVLDVAAPDPRKSPRFNPDARLAELVVARAEKKRERMTALWTGGKGHTGDLSAWEAWNGVVEAVDHEKDLWPANAGVYRTASNLSGWTRDLKERVRKSLMRYAEAR